MAEFSLKTALMQLREMPGKKRLPLLLSASTLLAILFLILIYLPLFRQTLHVGSEFQRVRDKLIEAQSIIRSYDEFKLENTQLKNNLDNFKKSRISEEEYSELLAVIIRAGKESGSELVSVRPLRGKQRERYEELPFEMVVKSRYHSLGKFLNELERADLLIQVQKISASTEKTTPPELEISLKAVAFFVRQ